MRTEELTQVTGDLYAGGGGYFLGNVAGRGPLRVDLSRSGGTGFVGQQVTVLGVLDPSGGTMAVRRIVPHVRIREAAAQISRSPDSGSPEENWLRAERALLSADEPGWAEPGGESP